MLRLTLKQPCSVKEVHSILETVLCSPFGNEDPDIHLELKFPYLQPRSNGDLLLTVECDGVASSTWLNLYETVKKQISSSRITLNLNFSGSKDAD